MSLLLKKLLSDDDLGSIADVIAGVERTTSGEIRVSVREKKTRKEHDATVEALARWEFEHLGMSNTRDRTGVLLFFLLETRQFYILADEGINSKVQDGTWQLIADIMSDHFSKQNFREGITQAVQAIGKALAEHFPKKPDDTNELTNQVHVR
ncbi:MAG: TPM domain-containing protein [Ignavibacteriales bacterium]|nr:TPM domain-containing protein [Ignavibacteriales bacterium]